MLPCLVKWQPHPRRSSSFLSVCPAIPVSEPFRPALSHSLDALCSKSVHQPFSNQPLPHSFSKMPGCMGFLPCDPRFDRSSTTFVERRSRSGRDVRTFVRADVQMTPRAILFLFTFLRTLLHFFALKKNST